MKVTVVYFGGQYNHLILKLLKNLGIDATSIEPTVKPEDINTDCLILGGGPYSVYQDLDKMGYAKEYITKLSIPIMGVCLGHELIAHVLGGVVRKAEKPEYGLTEIHIIKEDTLFRNLPRKLVVWESHSDEVIKEPQGFEVIAYSESAKIQAMVNEDKGFYSVQFHPEVKHTQHGVEIYKNFLSVCRR
ncbi:MAG: GMP synthase subunit A [Sulfolobaceae archaeon]